MRIFSPDNLPTQESRFLGWADYGNNLLLTGSAGTGKSYLLGQWLEQNPDNVAVTASTGIAALNIGGVTVHRWAGIQLGAGPDEEFDDAAGRLECLGRSFFRAQKRIKDTRTLVIDEISMLPGRQLDFLDFWFRRHRETDKPWGGLQVIMVGDFLQLPPVRKDTRPYDWAFASKAWRADGAIQRSIVLETVRRQDEPELVMALQNARLGILSGRAAEILMARVLENPPGKRPRLLTHNAQVDKWCDYMLSELDGEETALEALTTGNPMEVESLAKNILAPETLRLKVGARVMNLVNKDYVQFGATSEDMKSHVANGQVGIVREIYEDDSQIHVEFEGRAGAKEHVYVVPFTWAWSHNPPNKGGPSFIQYPLRLAYALTIHKAQGLTLDEAHIDIRAAREPGQAYVALSRVRSLSGLSLKDWPQGIFVSPEAIEFYESLKPGYKFKPTTTVAEALKRSRPAKPTEPASLEEDELPGLEPPPPVEEGTRFEDLEPTPTPGTFRPIISSDPYASKRKEDEAAAVRGYGRNYRAGD